MGVLILSFLILSSFFFILLNFDYRSRQYINEMDSFIDDDALNQDLSDKLVQVAQVPILSLGFSRVAADA